MGPSKLDKREEDSDPDLAPSSDEEVRMGDADSEESDTTPVCSKKVPVNAGYGVAPTVPDDPDILEKIMSHLPAASLIPCRQVSKRWDETVRRPNTLRLWAEQNAPIDIWAPLTYERGRASSLLLYNGRTREWKVQKVQERSTPRGKYARPPRTSSHGLLVVTSISRRLHHSPAIFVYNPITRVTRILPSLPNADSVLSICGTKFLDFKEANYGGSAYYRVLVLAKCRRVQDDLTSGSPDLLLNRIVDLTSYVFNSETGEWLQIGYRSMYEDHSFRVTPICQLLELQGEQSPRGEDSREHITLHFEAPENCDPVFGLEKSMSLVGYDVKNETGIDWRIRGSTWFGNPDTRNDFYRIPGGFIQRGGQLLVVIKEVDPNGRCVGVSIHSLSIEVEKPREAQHWSLVTEMPAHLLTRFHHGDANRCSCRSRPLRLERLDEINTSCSSHVAWVADPAADQIVFVGNCPFLVASYRFSSAGQGEWLDLQMPPRRGSTLKKEELALHDLFRLGYLCGMNFGLQLRPDISP